jgi:hypothetical protein
VYEYLKEKGYQVFLPQNERKEKQGKDISSSAEVCVEKKVRDDDH